MAVGTCIFGRILHVITAPPIRRSNGAIEQVRNIAPFEICLGNDSRYVRGVPSCDCLRLFVSCVCVSDLFLFHCAG